MPERVCQISTKYRVYQFYFPFLLSDICILTYTYISHIHMYICKRPGKLCNILKANLIYLHSYPMSETFCPANPRLLDFDMGHIEIIFFSPVKVSAIKNYNFFIHCWKYQSISTNAAMTELWRSLLESDLFLNCKFSWDNYSCRQ